MRQALVTTRPERTNDQIAADRKSATAFFERLSKRPSRDRGRLAERESYFYKLLMCEKEGREWAGKNTVTAAERRARKTVAIANNPLLNRDETKLRQYVAEETRNSMPLPQLHPQDSNQRRNSAVGSSAWRARVANPSLRLRGRVKKDATAHFEHWLLTHPQYGAERTADVRTHA